MTGPTRPPRQSNSKSLDDFDALLFANSSIEFAALALVAETSGRSSASVGLHLYALSIELGFKALAIAWGSTADECRACRHKISEMIALVEDKGGMISDVIKRRLNDDIWFKKMLGTRYPLMILNPSLEETVFFHKNYPEMIVEILETPTPLGFKFEAGTALETVRHCFDQKQSFASPHRSAQFPTR